MPLFFIVSGLVFSNEVFEKSSSLKLFVRKRISAILIPALFFELLMYGWGICKSIIENTYSVIFLVDSFMGIFLQIGYSRFSGALWFLFTYLIVQILAFVSEKYMKKSRWMIILLGIILSYSLAWLVPQLFLPWHLEIVPLCLAYTLIGVGARKFYARIGRRNSGIGAVICFSVWGLVYYWNYYCSGTGFALDAHMYHNWILDTVCAVSGSFCVILFFRWIDNMLWPRRLRLLTYIGENSMVYYGVQAVMVGILNTIIWHFVSDLYNLKGIILSLLSLGISSFIDTLICLEYHKYIRPKLQGLSVWLMKEER